MKKRNKIFNNIFNDIRSYTVSACINFSFGFKALTTDDLQQECYSKMLDIIERNIGKKKEEIIAIYHTSIYNLLRDLYRKEKLRFFDDINTEHNDEEDIHIDFPDLSFNFFENMLFDEFIKSVLNKLSEQDKKILNILITPDKQLVDIATKFWKKNVARKQKGKLVMNITEIKIMKSHIAERFRISPATVSRAFDKIKSVILETYYQ